MTSWVKNLLCTSAHLLLAVASMSSFLVAALLGVLSVAIGTGENGDPVIARLTSFWCFVAVDVFLLCFLVQLIAFKPLMFAPEHSPGTETSNWARLATSFSLLSIVSLFLLAWLHEFFKDIDLGLIAQAIPADGWDPLDGIIFSVIVGAAMAVQMVFAVIAGLYVVFRLRGRQPEKRNGQHLRSFFFFVFFGTSTVFFMWPALYQFLLVRLAVPHDTVAAYWVILASLALLFAYITILLSFALRYGKMVRLRYRIPFVFMTLIIVCTIFGLAYYSRDHSLQVQDVPGFRQYVQPTRGNFRYFVSTDELGSPLARVYFTDLLGREAHPEGEGGAGHAYRVVELEFAFDFAPGHNDLRPQKTGQQESLERLAEHLLFLQKQGRPFHLLLVGGSNLGRARRLQADSDDHALAWQRVQDCKRELLQELPKGFNPDHILCLPSGSTQRISDACGTLPGLCPPKGVVGSAALVGLPRTAPGDQGVGPNLHAVVLPGEREQVSQYITLLDALFYSSYTVTTTGYGLIPLDSVIKLYTTFENLFEVLIIAGLLAIVLSVGRPGVLDRKDVKIVIKKTGG
jgi:hypothetical protein